MAIDYPLVNGERHDFSSIEIVLDTPNGTKRFKGFKSINYSTELKATDIKGTRARKLGRTRGELTETASCEMYKAEWDEFREALGDGYMRKVFDVGISYAADSLPVTSAQLSGCRIEKVDNAHSAGADGLAVKLDLNVMKIIEDGLDPVGTDE